MASASVYYKFRSQKDFSRITFDGTGISVWDLKREIILQNKMGRGQDFDLKLFHADTKQEYTDDSAIVPRSSQVTAQRAPPSRPHEGTAQKYVAAHFAGLAGAAGLGENGPGSRFSHNANASGVASAPSASTAASLNENKRMGAMSRRFDGKTAPTAAAAPPAPDASTIDAPTGDEASSIAAMFAASNAEWDQAQQGMSTATYIGRGGITRRGGRGFHGGGRGGGGGGVPSERRSHGAHKPPGPGYICYRCGQKGHWIQDCPTNDDREFDNRPRLKRTTGIPKSMLKTIEQPAEGALLSGGVMITPDGSYVIAQADTASWQKNQALAKPLSENDVYAQLPSDSSLACPLCAKLLRNAVNTPCCGTLYCEECIQTHLLEHDFQCAECERRIPDLADLKRDEETVKKVRAYVEDVMARHERGEAGDGAGAGAGAEAGAEAGAADPNGESKPGGGRDAAAAGGASEADKAKPATNEVGTSKTTAEAVKAEALAAESAAASASAPSRRSAPLAGKHGLPPKPSADITSSAASASSSLPTLANANGGNNASSLSSLNSNSNNSNSNGNGNGNGNFVNPALMLPQMMMMLQNPNLPPPVRMQLQMNIQMIQSQLMSGVAVGGGGIGGGGMNMGMHSQQQQQQLQLQQRPLNPYNYQAPQHSSAGPYERVHVPSWNHNGGGGGGGLPGAMMMMNGMATNSNNSSVNTSRKRDRGQADLVEVAGGGGGGGGGGSGGGAEGGGVAASPDDNSPASKMARTS